MSDEKPAQTGGSRKVTMEELNKHKEHADLWLQINGKVYDVSKFMDEHPGGDEVLLTEAGKDATEAFEDVGHSDDARALLGPMLVGELEGAKVRAEKTPSANTDPTAASASNPILMFLPLVFLGLWMAYKNYA